MTIGFPAKIFMNGEEPVELIIALRVNRLIMLAKFLNTVKPWDQNQT